LHDLSGYESDGSGALAQRVEAGPVDVKGRWTLYGPAGAPKLPAQGAGPAPAAPRPGAAPCPVTAVLEFEEHHGPVVTDTHATETHRETGFERVDLKLTPGQPPTWAIGLGVADVLGERLPFGVVRHRLFGFGPCASVWAEVSLSPRVSDPWRSPVGGAVSCEFGR
jgi:hypothetical protein